MTTLRDFLLPDLGEGLSGAEIVRWHVDVGDEVELNQVLVEVETEKAVVELPSPFAGTVAELKAAPGEAVLVGHPIVVVSVSEDAGVAMAPEPASARASTSAVLVGYGPSEAPPSRRRARRPATVGVTDGSAGTTSWAANVSTVSSGPVLAKPPVRFLARRLGIDLVGVHGTGPGGVITRDDVLSAVPDIPPLSSPATNPGQSTAVSRVNDGARETRTPITGVRKHMADAMVRSAFTAPHVTEFLTVDVTPTMELLDRLGASRVFEGLRVTPLLLVAKALLVALRENPSLNSTWDETTGEIVTKHYVNLGIAAATPRGLLVPNIKDAHRLTLQDLARALSELTATAQQGRSTPIDLTGGTITITNIGVFGVHAGTPILNPGEAAILCLGAVHRQPWEFEGDIALRSVCTLSLSFDHRLVDGAEGSKFLAEVGQMLVDPTYLIALS